MFHRFARNRQKMSYHVYIRSNCGSVHNHHLTNIRISPSLERNLTVVNSTIGANYGRFAHEVANLLQTVVSTKIFGNAVQRNVREMYWQCCMITNVTNGSEIFLVNLLQKAVSSTFFRNILQGNVRTWCK